MTSLKLSPISAMIQGGNEIMLSPRRMIVVFGSIAVTTVLEMDVRSIATGAGCWAAILPATLSWNDCVSAVLKRVAVGLSVPPSVGTKDDPRVLRTKLLLAGYVATLAAVWPACERVCEACWSAAQPRSRRNR